MPMSRCNAALNIHSVVHTAALDTSVYIGHAI